MFELNQNDVLTRVTRYHWMCSGRSIHIDVHESMHGKLADQFVAVPSMVLVIAKPEYQGTGKTDVDALKDCINKIRHVDINDIFPRK
ncbi:MAG: hypothetical protein KKD44_19070 [Proteobacteria bacterium]|nr:hypothetical protein [Pseudomonadota bacterium]